MNNQITVTIYEFDPRSYPVESHADLLVAYHTELQVQSPLDYDTVRVIISDVQKRMLLAELNEQLASQKNYSGGPQLQLKGVCGREVEVRG